MKFSKWIESQPEGALSGDAFTVGELVWNAAKHDIQRADKDTIGRDCAELLDMAKYFKACGKEENAEFLIEIAGRYEFIFAEYWEKVNTPSATPPVAE